MKLASLCSDVNLVPAPVAHADAAVGDDSPLPLLEEDMKAEGNAIEGDSGCPSQDAVLMEVGSPKVAAPRLGCRFDLLGPGGPRDASGSGAPAPFEQGLL